MRVLVLLALFASLVKASNLRIIIPLDQGGETLVGDSAAKDMVDSGLDSGGVQRRKLSWRFVPGGKTIHDDTWYQDPDDERRDGGEGDGFDYLRDSDRCFKNGIYCRSCCPKPPDCNQDGEWGPAKLCINRVPRNDGKGFHVLAMKCIPLWGDCEKCMCGTMNPDGECEGNEGSDDIDDDRVDVNCRDLSQMSIMGNSWSVND